MLLEGSLEDIELAKIVQTVSVSRRSIAVELRDAGGAVFGTLVLKAGQIVSAASEGLSGTEALRKLVLGRRAGRFFVYRAASVDLREHVGPVADVLSNVLASPAPPPAASARPAAAQASAGARDASEVQLAQGNLGQFGLRQLLETLSLSRQCLGVDVLASDGRRIGALYVKAGQLLSATCGRSAGQAAARELLETRGEGRFEVFSGRAARCGEPLMTVRALLAPPAKDEGLLEVADEDISEADGDDVPVTQVVPQPGPTAGPPPSKSRPPPLPSSPPSPPRPATASSSVFPGAGAPPTGKAQPARPSAAAMAVVEPGAPAAPAPSPRPTTRRPAPGARSLPPPAPAISDAPAVASAAAQAEATARPESEAPAAPRFRRSEGSAAPEPRAPFVRDPTSDAAITARLSATRSRVPIVAITSPKGGAGRTTLALNLAVSLARRGRKVIVVDADASSLLPTLNVAERPFPGVADVLEGRAALGDTLLETRVPGLTLVPSGDLTDDTYRHRGWGALLTTLSQQADLVLVDCAPGWYGATLTVLAAASHQLLVLAAEPAARKVCSAYQARLETLLKRKPELLGLVINMLDYQVHASVRSLEELSGSEHARHVFDIPIPRSPAFMEASARGVPIVHVEQGASPTIAWVFETLATAVLERLRLERPVFASAPLLA